ncbi:MAG TPA: hypothetical protein VFM46_13815 [Pseudomonadales bacterium]|nr:hypothetical protein [Pseudomonadales bacterium]
METFPLVSGLLLLCVFSGYRIILLNEKHPSPNQFGQYAQPHKNLLPAVTIYQFLGLACIFFGVAFQTEMIHYPNGGLGLLLNALFLMVPVIAFAFYLGSREKGR